MASSFIVEIGSLTSQLQRLISRVQDDEPARKQLLGVTMGATSQLETGPEVIWRLMMSPHAPAAIMALLDLGIFELLAHNGDESMTAKVLAIKTGADESLLGKLLITSS